MYIQHSFKEFRCFTYKGRMRRKPFWLWLLPSVLFGAIAMTFLEILFKVFEKNPLGHFFTLVLLIVFFLEAGAVAFFLIFQRLHDIGLSGWWQILLAVLGLGCGIAGGFPDYAYMGLVGYVGSIVTHVIIALLPSQKRDNKYGSNIEANGNFLYQPKTESDEPELMLPRRVRTVRPLP